jgi:DNA-binding FrmR family transcriptional regulator
LGRFEKAKGLTPQEAASILCADHQQGKLAKVEEQQDEREKQKIVTRLRRVEGQIRGIQRMVREDRACEDIVTQLMAARSALDRAGLLIMSHHIRECLQSPPPEGEELERVVSFFLELANPLPQASEIEQESSENTSS